jgi:hypothetical protein
MGLERAGGAKLLLLVAPFLVLYGVGCGGTTSSTGVGSPGTGSSLVSTCAGICNNVLVTCSAPQAVYMQCLDACQNLDLVQSSCASDFAAYLTCLAGADSVRCGAGGQYVVLSPPSCDLQKQSYAVCSGGPPLAACIEISPNATMCATSSTHRRALLCVGVPVGCDSRGGLLGPYCCP